jgi:hypothetical protein
MIRHVRLLSTLSLCFVVACGKDDDTADETSSSSTDTTDDSATDTSGESIPCGEIECAADQACLTFPQEPMCTDKPEDQPCPRGTTETQCGGAGLPCCCGPTPAAVTECVDPACEGPVDCDCLADVCTPTCTPSVTAGVFICEAPARP